MRTPTIILALSLAACNWPFDYSQELEWPGGAPENCGDGVLDPDEQCDDGNRLDGDDCSANCLEMPSRVLNAVREGSQYDPDLVGSASEGFVLLYTHENTSGTNSLDIHASTFDANGNPKRTAGENWDLMVNNLSESYSQEQGAAALRGNWLVAVWMDLNAVNTEDGDIAVRVVELEGGMGEQEVVLNETTADLQQEPALAGNGDSSVMIAAWTTPRTPPFDVICKRVRDGEPDTEPEISCSESTDGSQHEPAAAMASDGSYAVAWTGEDADGSGVFVRFFGPGGAAQTGDLRVNSDTAGEQDRPSIAYDSAGRLLVAFRDVAPASQPVVRARIYSGGSAVGPAFQVSTGSMITDEDSAIPDVVGDVGRSGGGVFLVVWFAPGSGIMGRLVSGQNAFDVNRINPHPTGEPYSSTDEFNISGGVVARMREPTCAVAEPGKALVGWIEAPGGTESDIRGRIVPTW